MTLLQQSEWNNAFSQRTNQHAIDILRKDYCCERKLEFCIYVEYGKFSKRTIKHYVGVIGI